MSTACPFQAVRTVARRVGQFPLATRWFAGNQLEPMDHLGTRQFLFVGYGIGGCFAHKLMERAPERVVAGALVPPELKARTIDRVYAAGLHRSRWSMPER